MKLTVLGSGTILSTGRACAGFLLESGNKKLLVDLGEGAFTNLKIVSDPENISTVLLTHFHSDHVSALAPFFLYRCLMYKHNPAKGRIQLNLIGPKGTQAFFEALSILFPTLSDAPFKIVIKELSNSNLLLPGFRIKSRKMMHESCIAYRIEAENKSVVFSGDTALCDGIISLASNADLLVLECSLPDSMPSSNHLTIRQAAQIAEKARVKNLLLTHFYPAVEAKPIKKIVKCIYSGKVHMARDLLTVEF